MIDDDDDDEYYEDDASLVPEEKWENWLLVNNIREKYPNFHLMKVSNYSPQKLIDIEKWAEEFCIDDWEKIQWRGYCSYTTIIGFVSDVDAVHYKLRWG